MSAPPCALQLGGWLGIVSISNQPNDKNLQFLASKFDGYVHVSAIKSNGSLRFVEPDIGSISYQGVFREWVRMTLHLCLFIGAMIARMEQMFQLYTHGILTIHKGSSNLFMIIQPSIML